MPLSKSTAAQRVHIQIQVAEEILIPLAKAKRFSKLWLWRQNTHKTRGSEAGKQQPYRNLDAGSGRRRDRNTPLPAGEDLQCHQQVAEAELQVVRVLSGAATLHV